MEYNILLVDLSYILSRNIYSISNWKKAGEYTERDVAKSVFQTLSKLFKDYKISASKIIFLSDSWSKEYSGYYRTFLIKDLIEYKGDRKLSQEEESISYMNEIKMKSKEFIINNFGKFGIPTIKQEGWEADDLAWLSTNLLYDITPGKNLLITKDSDWKYLLSPRMDYFVFPKSASEVPGIITYEEMYNSIPLEIRGKGISLYDYSSYLNSLGVSHNNMKVTKKPRVNVTKTIIKILNNDFTNVADPEGFKIQYNSFDLTKFPGYQELKERIQNSILKIGHLGTSEEFVEFCDNNGIYGLTESYYLNFIGNLNTDYYCD
jgi:hypothetical protein